MRDGLGDLRVLVVDDSAAVCELIRVHLTMMGVIDVAVAYDADEGFDLFCDMRPRLVFSDWKMPPTSGLDFAWRIRRAPDSPNPMVPIIMMTGEVDAELEKAARDAGVTEFLIKPFSGATLSERLREALERPRAFVATTRYVGPCRRRRADDRRRTGDLQPA